MKTFEYQTTAVGTEKYWDAILLFLFSILFILIFLPKLSLHGDAYYYAHSIRTFEGPLVHLGYYALGHLVYPLFPLCSIDPVQGLRYMTVFFAGVAVSCEYLFVYSLTKNRFQSRLAGLILLFSGVFWLNAGCGIPYVPQLAFILLSVVAVLRAWPLTAGFLMLVAVSITPTSSLAFPGILYLMRLRDFQKRALFLFLLPIALAAIAVVIAGSSAIAGVIRESVFSPALFVKGFHPLSLFFLISRSIALVFGKSFGLFSLFALYGIVLLYRNKKRVFVLVLAFLLPYGLYIFNLGLFADNHLIVPFFIIAFLASHGLHHLRPALSARQWVARILTIFLLLLHASFSYTLFIGHQDRGAREFMRVADKLAAGYDKRGIMLAEYNFGIAYWYMKQKEDNFFLLTGKPNEFLKRSHVENVKALDRLRNEYWVTLYDIPGFVSMIRGSSDIFSNRQIYFVDRLDWPTEISRFVLPEKILSQRGERVSMLPHLRHFFGGNAHFTLFIQSPLYPVYQLQLNP